MIKTKTKPKTKVKEKTKKVAPKAASKEVDVIKEEANSFLEKLGVKGQADVEQKGDFFEINIVLKEEDASDGAILIGYHGETLAALQLILSLLVSKKLDNFVRIIVNVGDYRQKREEKLKEMAEDAAKRAKETKQEVVLGNLTSWQRRIVHVALSSDSEVMTESQGEEPDRQLVIKPRS